MRFMTMKACLAALAVLAGTVLAGHAAADEAYPSRPVRIIVPTGPGGANDASARAAAAALSTAFKQSFVVENRPGAQGLVAMRSFVAEAADGYTLLFMASSQTVLPAFYELPYDPVKSITPIARLSIAPVMLAINAELPARTVPEFIAYAKARPSEINYGYQGGPPQLAAATFAKLAGIEAVGVPFKASSEAMTELIAGRLSYQMMSAEQLKVQSDAGRLRGLATAGSERAPSFPDLPTLEELGYPVYGTSWFGLVGPANLSPAIVDKLWRALQSHFIGQPAQAKLESSGLVPASEGPEAFGRLVNAEILRWQKIATDLGIERAKR